MGILSEVTESETLAKAERVSEVVCDTVRKGVEIVIDGGSMSLAKEMVREEAKNGMEQITRETVRDGVKTIEVVNSSSPERGLEVVPFKGLTNVEPIADIQKGGDVLGRINREYHSTYEG